MREANKLAEYFGFEVVYPDGFGCIQEEGEQGPEIKREATLEERTMWTVLVRLSAELDALKAAMGEQAEDNWRKSATEREDTAQAVIDRHRNEHDSLLRLLEKDRQRIAELEQNNRDLSNDVQSFRKHALNEKAARLELERQLEEARKDAERYRWLRAQDSDDFEFAVVKNPHFDVYGSQGELDAAIDAAMQKGQS